MKKALAILAISLFFLLPIAAIAQVGPPSPPAGDPPCDGPGFAGVCPIDGGVSFLIAAGLALGAKKSYDLKRGA